MDGFPWNFEKTFVFCRGRIQLTNVIFWLFFHHHQKEETFTNPIKDPNLIDWNKFYTDIHDSQRIKPTDFDDPRLFLLCFCDFERSTSQSHCGQTPTRTNCKNLILLSYTRAIQLEIQLGLIVKPGNLAGPAFFISWHAAGDEKF